MKKNFTKADRKLIIHQEKIRRLSDLDMRAVNGGLTTGHLTCDSAMCESFGTNC